ncbi:MULTISPECIES: glycoside hydrolase family 25 protein [Sphingobacterium]|uniref:Glycoside hydrolase family 25 protein n=1 Tax=Sphingobacterium litopenaei TaxID=2763500 RepID=A0ABR7YDC7_9SPHI|nr:MULTISPECIES: GH25 family lysozyme [Sphingobacterium]MBD1429312.1 glycoside hydrolase family 25 protein [Sphingobacterium litopenaei]NGM71973.1 glycoside hydrolase family 25 protein [Sphingobacterium sp. SGL-16]
MAKYQKRSKKNVVSAAEERRRYLIWSVAIPFAVIVLIAIWNYRHSVKYYYHVLFDKEIKKGDSEKSKHDARNILLMNSHSDKSFGIDISQYQGKILWDSVSLINEEFPIDFVFVRATMGEKGKDSKFDQNWSAVQRINKLRGAYHYFRPNENSIKQANNFIKTVKLKPGDLPPVLDIEERPRRQSMDSLRVGLKRWLDRVEAHYKVKPIVYSGDSYFTDFLEKEFKDYKLWIANYNFWVESPKAHWDIWQFSEKGSVKGIKGFVDLNMYHLDVEDLEKLSIPFN